MRSFCASARSPASVGVYAHIAEAKPKDGGTWGYAGGACGGGEAYELYEGAFSFIERLDVCVTGGEYGAGGGCAWTG